MRILFTGNGTAGSWKIRGEQLGAACAGSISSPASQQALADAEMVVVVKRCTDKLLRELHDQDKRWVFDALDFYPQPECTTWSKKYAIDWVRKEIDRLNPNAIIWPNQQMMLDCSDGRPERVLYHHHRSSLIRNVPQDRPLVVAYEGSEKYLEHWNGFLQRECSKRGWTFVVNPSLLSNADVVVALRGPRFSGYAQFNWKSNVKLANAQGAGVPFIGQPEKGYLETTTGAELFVITEQDLSNALDKVSSLQVRERMSLVQLGNRYSVDQAARDLKEFLHGL